MPPLHLRQEFPTLKAFKEALHAWAIEAHFEPRILKSDTGRVRVGCKRDPNCPFVIRCNWERKGGREPLARVTVMREKHTCLNGVEWVETMAGMGVNNGGGMNGGMVGVGVNVNGGMGVEIRQDEEGNIVGGARVLGPVEGSGRDSIGGGIIPVLPKVQRNSASRLPFLMDILPRLMNITKETTPVEIRECLLREYGAEVHLQQCRRAKTEILKKASEVEQNGGGVQEMQVQNSNQGMGVGVGQGNGQGHAQQQSLDGMGGSESANDANTQLFGDMNGNLANGTPTQSPHPFALHNGPQQVVTPVMPERARSSALTTVGEPPVRCPYCINHRWLRSIKDAVEHMSMHVVV